MAVGHIENSRVKHDGELAGATLKQRIPAVLVHRQTGLRCLVDGPAVPDCA